MGFGGNILGVGALLSVGYAGIIAITEHKDSKKRDIYLSELVNGVKSKQCLLEGSDPLRTNTTSFNNLYIEILNGQPVIFEDNIRIARAFNPFMKVEYREYKGAQKLLIKGILEGACEDESVNDNN